MYADLERLRLGNLETVCDYPGVKTLGDVTIGLLEELSHQQHHRCCAVTANVVLGGRSTGDHDSCGVLYLHFAEEDVAILCQLDL